MRVINFQLKLAIFRGMSLFQASPAIDLGLVPVVRCKIDTRIQQLQRLSMVATTSTSRSRFQRLPYAAEASLFSISTMNGIKDGSCSIPIVAPRSSVRSAPSCSSCSCAAEGISVGSIPWSKLTTWFISVSVYPAGYASGISIGNILCGSTFLDFLFNLLSYFILFMRRLLFSRAPIRDNVLDNGPIGNTTLCLNWRPNTSAPNLIRFSSTSHRYFLGVDLGSLEL